MASSSNGRGKAARAPLAIVGIGCRFPGGASDPTSFWNLMMSRTDAVTEVPESRWNLKNFYNSEQGVPGKTYSRWGGFVDGIDEFEPEFFGIAPREAPYMDPQQRMLLEVAWESIEDAGVIPDRLSGSSTGVFVGISHMDYAQVQASPLELNTINAHTATGGAGSIAPARVSYCLNLKGPSLAVDTACSSSLVSAHLACRSIWNGESEQALAGGVNAIITPGAYIGFCAAGMLSPEGRCKAFDASANGFVRSEGAGFVFIKPLAKALAEGNPIYAVITGSAVNQDGRTTGIAAPGQESQADLLRMAYADAGVDSAAITFVEAHGTGTNVGDPIEARALGTVLSEGRDPAKPCHIGSVKTNIGHLESAAGVAGLIKAALCLQHRTMPPNLHFNEPNPDIPFGELKLQVPTEPVSLGEGILNAGVNSFGFGGTNAHLVLQSYPAQSGKKRATVSLSTNGDGFPRVLLLSSRTPEGLTGEAASFRKLFAEPKSDRYLDDVCYTARKHRTRFEYGLAVAFRSQAELTARLDAFQRGERTPGVVNTRRPSGREAKLAFVYPGQGPQWWGMGRTLMSKSSVFRETMEQCDRHIQTYGGWSLLTELGRDESESRLRETAIGQPAIAAMQAGLTDLFASWGIRPSAVVGHSVGEIAAAYASGVFSLESMIRLIVTRGQAMDRPSSRGKMLAASMSREDAETSIEGMEGRVVIAAHNAPTSVTLSGDPATLEKLAADLTAKDVFCKFLDVDYAFHSSHMDPAREAFLQGLDDLATGSPSTPMVSTVTGEPADTLTFDPGYWWSNVREPVRFDQAMGWFAENEFDSFVEIGPNPVLAGSIAEAFVSRGKRASILPSLRREEDDSTMLLGTVGGLESLGIEVPWTQLAPNGEFARLPRRAWNKESYWNETASFAMARTYTEHPLLGRFYGGANPTWVGSINKRILRYLDDHRVQGKAILPAAAFLEMALTAGRQILGENGSVVLEDLQYQRFLFLPDTLETPQIQFSLDLDDHSFSIYSRTSEDDDTWVQHAIGTLRLDSRPLPESPSFDPDPVIGRSTKLITPEEFYDERGENAVHHGPAFRGIETLWRRDGEALGRIQPTESCRETAPDYVIHPALLDACLQVAPMAVYESTIGEERPAIVPVGTERIRFHRCPGPEMWVHARLENSGTDVIEGDLTVYDADGVALEIEGFRYQTLDGRDGERETVSRWLFRDRWVSAPLPEISVPVRPADYFPAANEALAGAESLLRIRREIGELEKASRALELNALTAVAATFTELGFTYQPGDRFTAAELCAGLNIVERYHRLVGRFLGAFVQEGTFETDENGGFTLARPLDSLTSSPAFGEIVERFPSHLSALTLVTRCGDRLADILRGESDPLEALFPDGATSTVEQFYQDSPEFRAYNAAVETAIGRAVRDLPVDRPLRVLEVGAGTGGLTAHVLPVLPADRTHYVFSDVSVAFFPSAGQKFRHFPFVEYKAFDIEKDPSEQGFSEHEFDIILASDVLHATKSLRAGLGNLKRLLSPDGLLVFLEVEVTALWVDLVFGLTEGWWRFEDTDLRPDYPLLSGPAWVDLLGSEGFSDVAQLCADPNGAPSPQVVLWARGPRFDAGVLPALTDSEPHTEPWVIFADDGGVGDSLATLLRERGGAPIMVRAGSNPDANERSLLTSEHREVVLDPEDPDALAALTTRLQEIDLYPAHIVHAWSLNAAPAETTSSETLTHDEALGCHTAMDLAKAIALHPDSPPRLTLVTRLAQPLGDRGTRGFAQAGLLGLGRTIAGELPDLRCTLIDLGDDAPELSARAVLAELSSDSADREVVYRAGSRFVPRASEARPLPTQARRIAGNPADPAYRLTLPRPGVLDHLELAAVDRHPPEAGQVEIAVEAASLNFRDVLKALGLYPTDGGDHRIVGDECAGRVVAVGEGAPFAVGDPVIAIGPACLGSHVTTHAALVMPKPKNLTFEEAATIPIAFMTAYYALIRLAHLRRGEHVLIHSGAGGVGMAAIQIAKHLGATVYATAGNPEKRALLKELGVDHVMDSRSLSFYDDVMRLTGRRGVDVVLNSLAGQALAKGVACLAPYGRFLELGKRDIYQNSKIGLWSFRKNLSFFAVDLAGITLERLDEARELLSELFALLDEGVLHPHPYRVFPITRVGDAFRVMAQGKHVGKLVISMASDVVETASPAEVPDTTFEGDATYLIVGGFGGFGLTLAAWMIERGARHVALAGRSGADSKEATEALERLRATGAEIEPVRLDVSVPTSVRTVIAHLTDTMPPLRGVFHTAMVLDDGILENLDRERFLRVTDSKVRGAWNLHEATLGKNLHHFVMFSSVASVMGNHGQANYAAANAFLDALAHYRRTEGLPAIAINWGHLGEVGYLARNKEVADILDRRGIIGLSPSQAMEGLDLILGRNEPQIMCARADWNLLAKAFSTIGSPRFHPLVSHLLAEEDSGGDGSRIRSELQSASAEDRPGIVQDYVRDQVARVLGGSAENLDPERPLNELGLDSLMAVELKNRVEGDLGIVLPTRELMEEPTIESLTPVVLNQLGLGGSSGAKTRSAPATQRIEPGEDVSVTDPDEDEVPATPVAP